MNIQFVNFYCSSTKLTANIVQGLCLFLTHICSMLKQTNTKYQLFDFPADYFAVGLTVGLFLRGSVSESYQNNDISPSKHWYIFVPHFEIFLNWSVVSRRRKNLTTSSKVWLQQLHVSFLALEVSHFKWYWLLALTWLMWPWWP